MPFFVSRSRGTRERLLQDIAAWPLDPTSFTFAAISGAGGPGSARRDGAQGAFLDVAADSEIRRSRGARAPLLAWRSARLKRVVASTSAAET
eukprot:897548-Pyramimonas_sp.AAC.1